MSLLHRTYIGLTIAGGELRAVGMQRRGRQTRLVGGRLLSLPEGIWELSPHKVNIKDVGRFIARLKEVLGPLAGHEKRVALSLPAGCARVMVEEFETQFKGKDDGIQLIRWQLKSRLPGPAQEAAIDFQRSGQIEGGRPRYLIAAMAKPLLEQYETVLEGAGYHGLAIAFSPLHIGQYYHRRIDSAEPSLLIALEGDELSLQCSQEKQLCFFRQRQVARQVENVFQEINRSLVAMKEEFPSLGRAAIRLHSDWEQHDELCEALANLFEKKINSLDPHVDQLAAKSLNLPPWRVRGLVGAIGAAEQMM